MQVDDKFVKYPLPVNKEFVPWRIGYMQEGGNQLVELMEKEFPLSWIKENQKRLKINDMTITKIECWIEQNLVSGAIVRILNLPGSASGKNFFYQGEGVVRKLMREADITPIWDGEQFISRYSFIEYDVVGNEEGVLIIPKFSEKKWACKKPKNQDIKIISKQFFMKFEDSQWVSINPSNELANDLVIGYETMKRLTS